MSKKLKISAIVLTGTLAIGNVALPAMAANTTTNTPAVVTENDVEIQPRTALISLNTSSGATSIKVFWTRPKEAVKYIVTCGDQTQTLNTTSTAPYTNFSGLSRKTTYTISVRAYNSSGSIVASGSTTETTK